MCLTMSAVEDLRVIRPGDESVEDVQTLLVRSREAIHEQCQSEIGRFIAALVRPLAFVIHRRHFYIHKCEVLRRPHRGPPRRESRSSLRAGDRTPPKGLPL